MIPGADLLDNVLVQALTYGIATLGLMLAFRIVRYPDLTVDGSFVLGATVFAAVTLSSESWQVGTIFAVAAGGLAGAVTALLHALLGINRLLTGILTTMIAYSLSFRVLAGASTVGLGSSETIYAWSRSIEIERSSAEFTHLFQIVTTASVALFVCVLVLWLLRSEFGLVLRASGSNVSLVEKVGRSPKLYQLAGIATANAIVALSAALVVSQQGFADVNMGVGMLINLIAALVIGEEVLRRLAKSRVGTPAGRVVAAFLGTALYYLMYLSILRASIRGWVPFDIQPTDLKLLSALVLIVVIALRRSGPGREEILPL